MNVKYFWITLCLSSIFSINDAKTNLSDDLLTDESREINEINDHEIRRIETSEAHWSPWSQCSVSCGNGQRTRVRTICSIDVVTDHVRCREDVDQDWCSQQPCKTDDSDADLWSEWSACSQTCDKGYQSQVKICDASVNCNPVDQMYNIRFRPCSTGFSCSGQLRCLQNTRCVIQNDLGILQLYLGGGSSMKSCIEHCRSYPPCVAIGYQTGMCYTFSKDLCPDDMLQHDPTATYCHTEYASHDTTPSITQTTPPYGDIPTNISENIEFKVFPVNQTGELGGDIVFQCYAEGDVDINWYFLGLKLGDEIKLPGVQIYDRSILYISGIETEHYGVYACVATNRNGYSNSTEAWLTSDTAKSCAIHFKEVPRNTAVRSRSSIVLRCSVVEKTSSTVTWYHNNTQIIQNDRKKVLINNYLLVSRLTRADAGIYRCVVNSEQYSCQAEAAATITVYSDISEICGFPVVKSSVRRGFVVGGLEAPMGSAPWQAMLVDSRLQTDFCSGALISDRWVVTAAHCFHMLRRIHGLAARPPYIIVKLGKYSRAKSDLQEVSYKARQIYLHGAFNDIYYDNDIALIKLTRRVTFTDYIRPVCLGSEIGFRRSLMKVGRIGTVTGWGRLTENSPQRPERLMSITIPIVDENICRLSTSEIVTVNMFCAGYGIKGASDACHGDSGGPLTVKSNNSRSYLVGLVSWGEGCSKGGKYGFYTSVHKLYSWITDRVGRF
ncbi:uncharacterized protein LOC141900700 [Tubulanus polymorphus]|uniref:uncharacterized protein LOC141900700 n=1 Tax=Tubulanus polymorphus TaxID=672921 RepID=UPI003DA63369